MVRTPDDVDRFADGGNGRQGVLGVGQLDGGRRCCYFTAVTGTAARRTTVSATLPSSHLATPSRP